MPDIFDALGLDWMFKENKVTEFYLWAIRHKPTGHFLPNPHKNSPSWLEPEPVEKHMPRLFQSERSARGALIQWLRGKHQTEYEKDSSVDSFIPDTHAVNTITPVPSRKREEMELIRVKCQPVGQESFL